MVFIFAQFRFITNSRFNCGSHNIYHLKDKSAGMPVNGADGVVMGPNGGVTNHGTGLAMVIGSDRFVTGGGGGCFRAASCAVVSVVIMLAAP